MINIKLGNKLRELRKKRNLKQSEVAELTSLNVKTIQRYEKGENIPERFLSLFSEKINIDVIERFDLFTMMWDLGSDMKQAEEALYHTNKLLEILGYTIELREVEGTRRGDYIVSNKYTGDFFINPGSKYDFQYHRMVLSFLKMLIENDLNGEISLKNIDYLDKKEYKELTLKYQKKYFEIEEKISKYESEIEKIGLEEQKEIEALKQKLNPKTKK